ncbi:MAG: YggS family pyridoxal phosphate-dependent enzyme [Thermoanaerobaculia bacterium]|nr:YggS family pyridoxal phosphate-dependent enzyme [Thermoanaerobaculia bacterium]
MVTPRSASRPAHEIAHNLDAVRARIAAACERAHREPAAVQLIAVSKTFGADAVRSAIEAGVRDLGENRVQELREKIGEVGRDARWHMIGHLQSNKAKDAVHLFDVVQSVDRMSLAERLDKEAGEAGKKLDVLVQVNIGAEPQKSGVEIGDAAKLVQDVAALPNLSLRGLMTIPPIDDAQRTRGYFRALRELRDTIAAGMVPGALAELSMGMTDDFEIAIEEGATMVRVGRAIFGERG